MQPLLTSHIDDMDQARMAFIERLLHHIDALREELKNNEVILHSVIKSLSNKTTDMQQLDFDLHQQATEGSRHKPLILTQEEQHRLMNMREALKNELANVNAISDEQR